MITALIAELWPVVAAVVAVVAGYLFGRVRGADKVRLEQVTENAEAVQKAREAEHAISDLSESELRDRAIARGWVRDTKER